MLNQNRSNLQQTGRVLEPSFLNKPPDPEIVAPQPQLTAVTTESILGVLLPGLGTK